MIAMVLFFYSQNLFPPSDKKGFTVNLWVAEGSRVERVEKIGRDIAEYVQNQEGVSSVVLATGTSVPRFYVAVIPQYPNTSYAQLVVNLEDLRYLEELCAKLMQFAGRSYPEVMVGIRKYPNGTPVQYPVELAFSVPTLKYCGNLLIKPLRFFRKIPKFPA